MDHRWNDLHCNVKKEGGCQLEAQSYLSSTNQVTPKLL